MITERNFKTQVESENFYGYYLDVMNGVFKLTKKEKDILSWFLEREYYYNQNYIKDNVFSKSNRRLIEEQLGITPHYLNNYIKTLKGKKMIVKSKTGLEINPKVYIDKNDGVRIQFQVESVE